jgi:hypothetical protein
MSCKQAALLIEKYLDNRLKISDKEEFEDHLGLCKECSRKVLESKELYYYIKVQDSMKQDFVLSTESIMDQVYKIKDDTENGNIKNSDGIFFRRLGISMVLAAFIMLFSLFLPIGELNVFDNPVHAESSSKPQEALRINEAFNRIDNTIKSFINSIDFNFNK